MSCHPRTDGMPATLWRSVAEDMPDDGETVIIHTKDGEVWTGFIDGEVWRNVAGARIYDYDPVLHWMPFPNPPER